MILKLNFVLFFIMIVHSSEVDLDYFFNTALRSENVICKSELLKIDCQSKCGLDASLCINKKCYCITLNQRRNSLKDFRKHMEPRPQGINEAVATDFYDYSEAADPQPESKQTNIVKVANDYLDKTLLDEKPVLRHHIAHFCPNLDVARECIKTCMNKGKPAFCGKDHVCYCGHRYSNNDKDPDVNVSGIYAQFQDLYEKYFGPDYKPTINV